MSVYKCLSERRGGGGSGGVYCHGEENGGEESRVSSMAEAEGDLRGEIGVY